MRPNGDAATRARVERILGDGDACWCPVIRLELWNGAGGDREKAVLREFGRVLPDLPITDEVWQESVALARRARTRGVSVPSTDLLIAACARRHGAGLETSDADFELLVRLND